jgi:hypothetical protein
MRITVQEFGCKLLTCFVHQGQFPSHDLPKLVEFLLISWVLILILVASGISVDDCGSVLVLLFVRLSAEEASLREQIQ